jgi:GxxExxY protein
MPITAARELYRITDKEFHEIDYVMTGLAFQLHRELGPWFIEEAVYQNGLAQMCEAEGLSVCKELPVVAAFDTFSKTYFLDLVVNASVPYELKTVETIHPKHRSQTLNYLMLTGLAHASIFNFRCPSVQHEFVSTTITPSDRYSFSLNFDSWQDLDADGRWLSETMRHLIDEWGLFLDVTLFYDAVEHFRGGHEIVVRPVNIARNGRIIGRQLVHLINQFTAFKVTAISKDIEQFEKRLIKFLSVTSLNAIQWINFNRHDVLFKTLVRGTAG